VPNYGGGDAFYALSIPSGSSYLQVTTCTTATAYDTVVGLTADCPAGNLTLDSEMDLIALSDNDPARLPVPTPAGASTSSTCSTVEVFMPPSGTLYVTVTGKTGTDAGAFGLAWTTYSGTAPSLSPFPHTATGSVLPSTTSGADAIAASGAQSASLAIAAFVAAGMAVVMHGR
jgi:hypothetical protein